MKKKMSNFDVISRTSLKDINGGGMAPANRACYPFRCDTQPAWYADQYCANSAGGSGCKCNWLPISGPRYCTGF